VRADGASARGRCSSNLERLVYEADTGVAPRGRRVGTHEETEGTFDADLGLDSHHHLDRASPRRLRLQAARTVGTALSARLVSGSTGERRAADRAVRAPSSSSRRSSMHPRQRAAGPFRSPGTDAPWTREVPRRGR
jgi:hypothetical protein